MSRTDQVEHTDSISSQDPNREEPKKTKSRRPPSKNSPGRAHMCAWCAERGCTDEGNRYCVQAAAFESMAVSARHGDALPSQLTAQQAHLNAEDRPSSFLHRRSNLCAHRWAAIVC
ncbi:hypothetical protein IG631_22242 [Alternaria alternata]|nr:hypothetical protein IG631_22242 [Alternaria alternata]